MRRWARYTKPVTRLERAIDARDRYHAYRSRKQPSGANSEEFAVWREWVDARRDYINAEIKAAMIEKRHNQRSKANERKHSPGGE